MFWGEEIRFLCIQGNVQCCLRRRIDFKKIRMWKVKLNKSLGNGQNKKAETRQFSCLRCQILRKTVSPCLRWILYQNQRSIGPYKGPFLPTLVLGCGKSKPQKGQFGKPIDLLANTESYSFHIRLSNLQFDNHFTRTHARTHTYSCKCVQVYSGCVWKPLGGKPTQLNDLW